MIAARMKVVGSIISFALLLPVAAGCAFDSSGLPATDRRADRPADRPADAAGDAAPELRVDSLHPEDLPAPPERRRLDRFLVEATTSCGGSAGCPGDRVCKQSTCVTPWGIPYTVTLVSAVVACPNPSATGGIWNSSTSDPNPQVVVEVDGAKHTFPAVTGNCHPSWTGAGASTQVTIAALSTVAIRVYNKKTSSSDFIGGLTFSGAIAVDAAVDSLLTLLKADGFTDRTVSQAVLALTVKVVPAP